MRGGESAAFHGLHGKNLWHFLPLSAWRNAGITEKIRSMEGKFGAGQKETGKMGKYRLSKYEQEVVIGFNAEEDAADLYTADPVWIRKMDRLVEQNPEQFKLVRVEKCQGDVVSKRYTLPKRFISIRSKDVKRELTDEQRQAASERMRQIRESR